MQTVPYLPPNSNYHNPNSNHRKNAISLLQNCRNLDQIAPIHTNIIKNGQEHDHFVVFELLRACSRFDAIDYAIEIFRRSRKPNVYVYTALIDGLVASGSYNYAISLYVQMIENFVFPDNFVINSALKACGLELDLEIGKQIQAHGLKLGLCSNRQVKLKLMELYGKCGEFDDMKKVFNEMPERDAVAMTVVISSYLEHKLVERACSVFDLVKGKDTVCWTAMIDGLVRNNEMSKALEYFRRMQREGVSANEVTVVCVLSACSQLGALELGKWTHSYVEKYDIKVNHFVASALINMYSRCGSIEEAVRVFEEAKEKEVSTYNSMIVGLALNGKSAEAVQIFKRMINEGSRPTSITFVGVLNACSHGGLVDIGFEIFKSMELDYDIEPRVEHYGCMVDLLGRAGHVHEAYKFIQKMKVAPDHIMWGSLLSTCKAHKKYELGENVAKSLLDDSCSDTGTYIIASNFYSSWGKWDEALVVRGKLKERGIEKEPGSSSIEVNGEIHEFLLGDIRHPQKKAIYTKLEEMDQKLRAEGYHPQVDSVSQDLVDEEKERALAIHSERLAICYGLISTEPCSSVRIVKNLRVCDDCHTMMKLISKSSSLSTSSSIMNFDPNEAANYKVDETEYIDTNAELGGSDVDDKLMEVGSDICMSDGGEMINFYDEKSFSMQELHANVEPYVGMEFESEESALAYYDAYAKRVGFIIRIGNCHRSSHDGSVISRRFVCNKEGFRVNKKVKRLEVRKPRAVTREGCKAMIMIKKEKSGTWIIAKVETQHSHLLGISPGNVRPGPVKAQLQDEKDKRIRELSSELHRTKQKLADCQKQLDAVLNDVEVHVDHLTRSVQYLVQNVKEIEK
ncbi:Tetratricopeptide repeat superfamily protein [Perilla frutescens var. frutescens]|nr:Tetratricopeptide repeat superfamily protein [Perilla frutescens var. frutescens]